MRRVLFATAVLLAAPAAADRLAADSPHAAMQVSVQVVRSCRVQSGGPTATLDCGPSGPSTVQVSVNGHPPSLETLGDRSSGAASTVASTPEGTRTLSIDF
jgi:hypothetical protein